MKTQTINPVFSDKHRKENDTKFKETVKTDIRVEFESTPIRHMAVRCPNCKEWFHRADIVKSSCHYKYEIADAHCECPSCGCDFYISEESDITEMSAPDIYEDCMEKEVKWRRREK